MAINYSLPKNVEIGVQNGTYYGAHLRTAKDAAAAGGTKYKTQSDNLLKDAISHSLSLIYLASGNAVDTEKFITEAASQNITVISKNHILESDELESER
jgi:hypothetical protein